MNEFDTEIIGKSILFAKEKMKNSHSSHGWDHIERVLNLANKLTNYSKTNSSPDSEKPDKFIMSTSIILHDIAREDENKSNGKICHAETGSEMAYDFLTNTGLDIERASHIKECILTHRFRNNRTPVTFEAKILFDADKLDSIGATGIGRAFLFSGEIGARLHNADVDVLKTEAYSKDDSAFREFMVKLRHIKNKMLTKHGKRMAEERHTFMEKFFFRLQNEINGEL